VDAASGLEREAIRTAGASFSVSATPPFHLEEDDMSTQHHQMITKILAGAAIAFGLWVEGATPASADPNSVGTDPNPFNGLSCNCRETAPAGSPELREEIDRGIREGLSAELPGLPAVQPNQPRP
jgi:hypothetical protein